MVYTGAKAVVTTDVAVQISTTSMKFCTGRIKGIKASGGANSGIVYVGGSGVTAATGYPIAVGGELTLDSMETDSWDLLDFWVVGAATDGVVYFVARR